MSVGIFRQAGCNDPRLLIDGPSALSEVVDLYESKLAPSLEQSFQHPHNIADLLLQLSTSFNMRNIRPSIFLSICIHTLLVMSHVTTGRDGHGLIGYGISMYKPLCAYVCRDLLSTSMLNCSETMDMSGGMSMHMHGASETSPDCYATDDAFLGTLAYCISTHCQGTAIYELERYWSLNVAGRQPDQPLPKASYQETLAGITLEPTETLVVGEELNQTMLVSDEDYEMSYNAQAIFEKMEVNHETYGYVFGPSPEYPK